METLHVVVRVWKPETYSPRVTCTPQDYQNMQNTTLLAKCAIVTYDDKDIAGQNTPLKP